MKDGEWLLGRLIHFFEFELRGKDKERFDKMKGKEYAYALMNAYGFYLIQYAKKKKLLKM